VSSVSVPAGLGKPIKGPSALGSDPRRFWHLTWTMAVTDWKLRFFGSALGYLWSVLRPLMLFGVLYAVFTAFLGKAVTAPYYPSALLFGIVLYSFFSEATKGCVGSLVAREPLVRKIEFPRAAVPLSVVLGATFNLALNLLPVFVFLVAAGAPARWTWLELPVLIVLLALFATGLGLLVATYFVSYRDVEPIWDVVLQVMFYVSPIFYPIEKVLDGHEQVAHLMMCNPFAAILQQGRHALLGPGHLSAAEAIGGWAMMAVPIGIAAAVILLGVWLFDRRAPRIAEEL
jgi:ABC-2 type transport system permease protein